MGYASDRMLELMGMSFDLQGMLKEQGKSQGQLLQMLRTKRARTQVKWLRQLGKIHGQLLVARYSPAAVNRLFNLVQDGKQKPEVSLRAAMALLQITGLDFDPHKKKKLNLVKDMETKVTVEQRDSIMGALTVGYLVQKEQGKR